MPSPTRRRSIWASSPITSPSASILGCMVCLRLKASKLAHQGGGAQRILMDLVDFLERGIARRMAHQKEFAIADDDGEKIVEVMRHAAGQLAHRLHLLGLGEFGFQCLLFGDIDQIKHRAARHGAGEQFRHAARQGLRSSIGRGRHSRPAAAVRSALAQAPGCLASTRTRRNRCPPARPSGRRIAESGIGVADRALGIGESHAHRRIAKQIAGEA